jgi:hypothetical protein
VRCWVSQLCVTPSRWRCALPALEPKPVIAGIDLVYVAPRRVSPAYPLDAWADLGLLGAWMWAVNDTTLMIVLPVVIDCRVGR